MTEKKQLKAHPLQPDETLTRWFLSSPAYFVGSTKASDYLLTLAFSNTPWARRDQWEDHPHSRNYLVLSLEHEPWALQSVVAPNYAGFAQAITDLSSVWYGKLITLHGAFESHANFHMPDIQFPTLSMPDLGPYNSSPRPDLNIELNLGSVETLINCLDEAEHDIGPALRAAHYYNQALYAFNFDEEIAYLELVSALEILAAELDVAEEDLYDEDSKEVLDTIAAMPDGQDIVAFLKGRFYQSRRRVALVGREFAGPRLFEGSEAKEEHAPLQADTLEACLKAAYDVRSRRLHVGTHFGGHVTPHSRLHNELQLGRPVVEHDKKMAKALAKAPTFLGLERVTRFAILCYIHHRIGNIHDGLARTVPNRSERNR